jgi:ABC-type cobalt transport system substrate-binding protein
MILELYIIFIFVSIALITLGYYAKVTPLIIVGFTFMFIFNSVPAVSGIDYHNGDNVTKVDSTHTTIIKTYENYSNRILFILFSILGLLGGAFLGWDEYNNRKRKREE